MQYASNELIRWIFFVVVNGIFISFLKGFVERVTACADYRTNACNFLWPHMMIMASL